jgi:Zn-dependent alcohol dehydrogenase
VAVIGDGVVGLCAIITAKRLAAVRIVAMSWHESRRKLAVEFGATDVVAERGTDGIDSALRCCTSLGEQVALPCDELLDGLRGSAGDFLDGGGHAVIPILAM